MPAGKRELERLVVKIDGDNIDYKRKMAEVKTEAKRTSAGIGGIWNAMSRKITAPLRGMERQTSATFSTIGRNVEKTHAKIGKAAVGVGKFTNSLRRAAIAAGVVGTALTLAAIPLTGFANSAVRASIEFESSFTGIIKTVNATEAELDQLRKTIQGMALRIPIDVNELNKIGESAGQLGIQVPYLANFVEVMAKLGVTTNLASDQAASQLARLANITQMSQKDFDRLGSTIVALGNNFATTEAEIADLALRIAGAGHAVNLSEHQILSLAAALSSLGIESEMGGSAISKLLINMASAASEGGDDIANFAKAAGMSVRDFTRLVKTDAAGAIVAFSTGLHKMKLSGDDVLGMLGELGIDEVRLRDTVLRLAGSGDLLTRSLNLGAVAWKENTALTREAELRFGTTASKLQLLKNRYDAVLRSVGDSLIPVLGALVRVAELTLPVIQQMADAFGALPEPIQTAVIGLGALATVGLTGFSAAAVTISTIIDSVGKLIVLYKNWSSVAVDSASMMAKAYRAAAGQVTVLGTGTRQLTNLITQQTAAYKSLATAQTLALGSDAAGGLARTGTGLAGRGMGGGNAKRITNAADDIIDVEFVKHGPQKLLGGPVAGVAGQAAGGLAGSNKAVSALSSGISKLMGGLKSLGAAFMAMGLAAQIGWGMATLGASLVIGAIIAAGVAIWKFRDDIMAAVEPLIEPFRPLIAEIQALGAEIWAFVKGAAAQMWQEVKINLVPVLQEFAVLMGGTLVPVLRSMLPVIKAIVEGGFYVMIQAAKGLAESLMLVVRTMREMWDLVVKLTPGMANLIQNNLPGGKKPAAATPAAKPAGKGPAIMPVYGRGGTGAAPSAAPAAAAGALGMGEATIGTGVASAGGGTPTGSPAAQGRMVFDAMTGSYRPESEIASRQAAISGAPSTFERNFGNGFWWERLPGRLNVPLGGLQKPLRSPTAKPIVATPEQERQARIKARLAKQPKGFINRTYADGTINRSHFRAPGVATTEGYRASEFSPRRRPVSRPVAVQSTPTEGGSNEDPQVLLRKIVENTSSLRNKTIPVVGAGLRQ